MKEQWTLSEEREQMLADIRRLRDALKQCVEDLHTFNIDNGFDAMDALKETERYE